MYKYIFDEETGGLKLQDSDEHFSKEPRPVYAAEMNILGFDRLFHYDNQNDVPYLWAEAGNYIYRGKTIAVVKGGSLYEKPSLDFTQEGNSMQGETLLPVDLKRMSEKNREIMESLRQLTVKRIFNYWRRMRKKLDCFHVAFSGGKDSVVLLDLVKQALPKSAFIVVFGDTRMEFPDTYKIVDLIEKQCAAEKIAFYRAASTLMPEQSWKLFGPPSRQLRWCCSVHKAAPQALKIREVLNKSDYVGAAFIGVRAHESLARSEYNIESFGEKLRGQYMHHPILEWGAAEIWLYILMRGLPINETYKKGNSRAGCLFCPLASSKNNFFKMQVYGQEIEKYISVVFSTLNPESTDSSYVESGAWIVRRSGRDLKNPMTNYSERRADGYLTITVVEPKSDWREWFKTLGEPTFPFKITFDVASRTVVAKIKEDYDKTPEAKIFKSVFHKAATCVGCGVCEANCRFGAISFKDGLHIDGKKCVHCLQCHSIVNGCHLYDSTRITKEGGNTLKGLNVFSTHTPTPEWIKIFFDKGNGFRDSHKGLPDPKFKTLKHFMIDSEIAEADGKELKTSNLFDRIKKIGITSPTAWGIIFVNLVCNNKQMRWYVKNMPVGQIFSDKEIKEKLLVDNGSVNNANQISNAFKHLCNTPLGTELNFGTTTSDGKNLVTLQRTKARVDDARVILYALYRFAEATGGWYQFTLTRLMSDADSEGVSPTTIFGIDREEMQRMLNGLSTNYPEFISATFTHDLEKISLMPEKTSQDVLNLFDR